MLAPGVVLLTLVTAAPSVAAAATHQHDRLLLAPAQLLLATAAVAVAPAARSRLKADGGSALEGALDPTPELTWPGNTTLYVHGAGCQPVNGYYYELSASNLVNITKGYRRYPGGPGATDIHRSDGGNTWDMGVLDQWGAYGTRQSERAPDGSRSPSTKGWTGGAYAYLQTGTAATTGQQLHHTSEH
jgi:hypothetical protein